MQISNIQKSDKDKSSFECPVFGSLLYSNLVCDVSSVSKMAGRSVFWVDVLVYVELNGNIELFSGLESNIVVTQFPRYTSQHGLEYFSTSTTSSIYC